MSADDIDDPDREALIRVRDHHDDVVIRSLARRIIQLEAAAKEQNDAVDRFHDWFAKCEMMTSQVEAVLIHPEEGDVIVFRTPKIFASEKDIERLMEHAERVFPGLKPIVLEGGMTLELYRVQPRDTLRFPSRGEFKP